MSQRKDCHTDKKKLCSQCEGHTLESVPDLTYEEQKLEARKKGAMVMLELYKKVKEEESKEEDTAPAPAPATTAAALPALFLSVAAAPGH